VSGRRKMDGAADADVWSKCQSEIIGKLSDAPALRDTASPAHIGLHNIDAAEPNQLARLEA
jgi:hypothetical protein